MSRSTWRANPQTARTLAAAASPGPGEPRLDGAFRNAEHARRFHEIHLLKVIQDQRLAILHRQRQHGAAKQRGPLLILQPGERVGAMVHRPCGVERCSHRLPVTQARAIGAERQARERFGVLKKIAEQPSESAKLVLDLLRRKK